jgi:PAS domain-containing protein
LHDKRIKVWNSSEGRASGAATLSRDRYRGSPERNGHFADRSRAGHLRHRFPCHAERVRQRRSPAVGIDVLATKVALDFQSLSSEGGGNTVKRNLEALRDATGVEAICIVLFDRREANGRARRERDQHVRTLRSAGAQGRDAREAALARRGLSHLRVAEIRDTQIPRREHAADAARFLAMNVRSALVCGLSLNDRVCGFMALCSSQPARWLGREPAPAAEARRRELCRRASSGCASSATSAELEERNSLSLHFGQRRLWDFDVENNTVYFSPRWRKMLGYDEHDPHVSPDWRRSCTRTTWRACRR